MKLRLKCNDAFFFDSYFHIPQSSYKQFRSVCLTLLKPYFVLILRLPFTCRSRLLVLGKKLLSKLVSEP